MKAFYSILNIALLFLLVSCKNGNNINQENLETGAVVITFDDQSIDEWFACRALFNIYNVKATFFITRPFLLDSSKIEKLKLLVNDGHEIDRKSTRLNSSH